MRKLSSYGQGSFVCLVCGGIFFLLYWLASQSKTDDFFIGFLMVSAYGLQFPAYAIGAVIGLSGIAMGDNWQARSEAFFGGLLCGGAFYLVMTT